jgi:hypothetical protein
MVATMESAPVGGQTQTGSVFDEIASRASRRSLIIVLSDFLDELENVFRGCKHLQHQRHDLCLLQVLDPAEADFPFQSPIKFLGMEQSGELVVDPMAIRRDYLDEFQRHQTTLQSFCNHAEIDFQTFGTQQPLSTSLPFYLARRERMHHQRGKNHA